MEELVVNRLGRLISRIAYIMLENEVESAEENDFALYTTVSGLLRPGWRDCNWR